MFPLLWDGLLRVGMSVPAHPQAIERLMGYGNKGGIGLLDRIDRFEEDLSPARLTLHAASALPPSLFERWRTRKPQSPPRQIVRFLES